MGWEWDWAVVAGLIGGKLTLVGVSPPSTKGEKRPKVDAGAPATGLALSTRREWLLAG